MSFQHLNGGNNPQNLCNAKRSSFHDIPRQLKPQRGGLHDFVARVTLGQPKPRRGLQAPIDEGYIIIRGLHYNDEGYIALTRRSSIDIVNSRTLCVCMARGRV